jgi:hypothetical protein
LAAIAMAGLSKGLPGSPGTVKKRHFNLPLPAS